MSDFLKNIVADAFGPTTRYSEGSTAAHFDHGSAAVAEFDGSLVRESPTNEEVHAETMFKSPIETALHDLPAVGTTAPARPPDLTAESELVEKVNDDIPAPPIRTMASSSDSSNTSLPPNPKPEQMKSPQAPALPGTGGMGEPSNHPSGSRKKQNKTAPTPAATANGANLAHSETAPLTGERYGHSQREQKDGQDTASIANQQAGLPAPGGNETYRSLPRQPAAHSGPSPVKEETALPGLISPADKMLPSSTNGHRAETFRHQDCEANRPDDAASPHPPERPSATPQWQPVVYNDNGAEEPSMPKKIPNRAVDPAASRPSPRPVKSPPHHHRDVNDTKGDEQQTRSENRSSAVSHPPPSVYIGQVDIIVETPGEPPTNVSPLPGGAGSFLDTSASFLRRL
ncbi:MAG: hypothetical protein HKP58_18835 [Desulfatitalea sp.]|nr:hypothetical protein [Desulfatitalea sp.]NNK02472.1 hypothetical protein [Desulfatitalea sp.]